MAILASLRRRASDMAGCATVRPAEARPGAISSLGASARGCSCIPRSLPRPAPPPASLGHPALETPHLASVEPDTTQNTAGPCLRPPVSPWLSTRYDWLSRCTAAAGERCHGANSHQGADNVASRCSYCDTIRHRDWDQLTPSANGQYQPYVCDQPTPTST
jgi:hypothetical protein